MRVLWWRVGASGRVGLSVGDITEWGGDAVVNAAKETLLGGGGVDGALHAAAGPGLVEECREIPEVRPGVRCQTGAAQITGGHALSAAHVIHTVGPVYAAHAPENARALLSQSYRSCLSLANEKGFKSIAFPAISCGAFGYPVSEAARMALTTVASHAGTLEEVHFILYDSKTMEIFREAASLVLGDEIPDYSTYLA